MNKQEFLERMRQLNACHESMFYVRNHASDDAQVIWKECQNVEWLKWYAFRVAPGFAKCFAFKAADRARLFAAKALEKDYPKHSEALRNLAPIVDVATANAAGYAASDASYAASSAAWVAASYAARAASYAVSDATYAASYAASYAARAASYAARDASYAVSAAAMDAEINAQIKRLHRWSVR